MISFFVRKWECDSWFSREGRFIAHDKVEQFVFGFVGAYIALFAWYPIPIWMGALFAELTAIVWNIKDGLFSYDGAHIAGFSPKRLISSTAGIVLAIIFFRLMLG